MPDANKGLSLSLEVGVIGLVALVMGGVALAYVLRARPVMVAPEPSWFVIRDQRGRIASVQQYQDGSPFTGSPISQN